MAYYYVKSGGTAASATDNGRYVTQQTGTFATIGAAGYYATIEDCLNAATTPTDGDFILVSSSHAGSYAPSAAVNFNSGGAVAGAGLVVASVDDSNCENYLPGASETLTGTTHEYNWYYNGVIAGIDLQMGDSPYSGNIRYWEYRDCTITQTTSSDFCVGCVTPMGHIRLINVNLTNSAGGTDYLVQLYGGGRFEWFKGTATGTDLFANNFAINGGAHSYVEGVDLSGLTELFDQSLTDSNDNFLIKLHHCNIPTGDPLGGGFHRALYIPGHRIEMTNCGDFADSDNETEYFRHYYATSSGSARLQASIYVSADDAMYESSDIVAYEIETTATCSALKPFVFDLCQEYVDLSSTSSDVLHIDMTTETAVTLTDTEFMAYLVAPDNTGAVNTSYHPNWFVDGYVVGSDFGADPLTDASQGDGSSALTNTGGLAAGDWTGEDATSPNFYRVSLDTSGNGCKAAIVKPRIEIRKASIAGGGLTISPQLTTA